MPIRKIVSVAALVICPFALPGCAAAIQAIPVIQSVVTDAARVLTIIDIAVREFFRTHDTPGDIKARYAELMSRTHVALNASQKLLRGVQDIDQKQYDAAFVEFREAYKELVGLLRDEGLMRGNKLAGRDGADPVEVPEPEAMTLQVPR